LRSSSDGGAAGGLSVAVSGINGGQRGAWNLSNDNNSYTGTTSVTNGTLLFTSIADSGANSSIGAGNALSINGGSHVKYLGGAASTNRTITGGGSFYNFGTGALTLAGAVNLPGTLTFRGSQNFIIDGLVSGTGGLNRTDAGTIFLNNTNTFTGNLSASDGAFRFETISNKGVNSAIGAGSTITLGQNSSTTGRIEFSGATGGSSDRDIRLANGNSASSGNGRINNLIAGQTLTLSGNVRVTSATTTHVASLNLTGVGDGVMSGIIGGTNSSAAASVNLSILKDNTGTWALSGANNYYRGTTISAGTLLALNASGSATGTGDVTTSGSGALGGTGFVTGSNAASLTIASGTRLFVGTTHNLSAGSAGPAGTTSGVADFHFGSAADVAITLAGTLQFDLFSGSDGLTAGSADKLFLETTAAAITLGGSVALADVSEIHAPWRTGTWQLIDWTGTGPASQTGALTLNSSAISLASGYSFDSTDLTAGGTVSIAKTAANHTWLGTTDNSWATATNWEAGTVPGSGNDVFFGTAPIVTHNIDGDKQVRNLYFDGDADHTINTGSGGVLYSTGGYLEVLGGSQRFGAQLRVTNGNVSQYYVLNSGTLRFDNPIMYHRFSGSQSIDIVFRGTGDTSVPNFQRRTNGYDVNVVVDGPGTVTLSNSTTVEALANGAGSITGTTTVNGGKLRLNSEGNLGGNPAILNPAHLAVNGGTINAYASFEIDDANRGITLGSNGGTFETDASVTLTLTSTVTGEGKLTKTGNGILILNGDNDYTGTTEVNAGTLLVNGTQTGATGDVTVASGATLGGTGTIFGATTIESGGTLTGATNGTTGTLSFNGSLDVTTGSTWLVDLVNNSMTADLIQVGGALTLNGALSIADTGTFIGDSTYTIATYGSLLGGGFSNDSDYNGLLMTGLYDGGGGKLWTINYNDGGAITLTAVPEPGTYLVLSLLLGGLLYFRHRTAKALRPAEIR
jgi:autotransporter-associated beta strand protein